jgi:hypothetical protein
MTRAGGTCFGPSRLAVEVVGGLPFSRGFGTILREKGGDISLSSPLPPDALSSPLPPVALSIPLLRGAPARDEMQMLRPVYRFQPFGIGVNQGPPLPTTQGCGTHVNSKPQAPQPRRVNALCPAHFCGDMLRLRAKFKTNSGVECGPPDPLHVRLVPQPCNSRAQK